jgi:hypothetical protein
MDTSVIKELYATNHYYSKTMKQWSVSFKLNNDVKMYEVTIVIFDEEYPYWDASLISSEGKELLSYELAWRDEILCQIVHAIKKHSKHRLRLLHVDKIKVFKKEFDANDFKEIVKVEMKE